MVRFLVSEVTLYTSEWGVRDQPTYNFEVKPWSFRGKHVFRIVLRTTLSGMYSWPQLKSVSGARNPSGDTTPCAIIGVTLQSHVRYKEIQARTCCGPLFYQSETPSTLKGLGTSCQTKGRHRHQYGTLGQLGQDEPASEPHPSIACQHSVSQLHDRFFSGRGEFW